MVSLDIGNSCTSCSRKAFTLWTSNTYGKVCAAVIKQIAIQRKFKTELMSTITDGLGLINADSVSEWTPGTVTRKTALTSPAGSRRATSTPALHVLVIQQLLQASPFCSLLLRRVNFNSVRNRRKSACPKPL
ncbi:hypothetical protein BaRGS_00001283 [Batillaria attramentaria]|uniref:Pantothenate kinase n=1 Tax=Batillaria attramentaria TaxID=370345 RepID=A0ABD0M7Z4_9CAEN